MFTINNNRKKKGGYLELKKGKDTYAKIILNQGASLQELILNNKSIIKDLAPLKYEDTYASSVLFPFVSRIEKGMYTFQGKVYELECNDVNNALHGHIYNKTFEVINKEANETSASVTLSYDQKKRTKGFPFLYSLFLTYTLEQNKISLEVTVKNTDKEPFPFTLGWHPYFYSTDLYNSTVYFDSDKKIVFDKDLITKGAKKIKNLKILKVENKKLDDCYILNKNIIKFKTPGYSIILNSSSEENYLQLYTPDSNNYIAIEPMTGTSNSFNNKLGLQIIESRKTYNLNWTISLQ